MGIESGSRNQLVKSAVIRGLATSWIEAGVPGNPVAFFCHGFPDDPLTWQGQIDKFSNSFHVIAPYVRGCDLSAPSDSLSRYGSDAILLDHLEVLTCANISPETKMVVIGHDLGCVHALNLSRAQSERVIATVIINGGDIGLFSRRFNRPRQIAKSWYMGLFQLPLVPELLIKYAPETCSVLAGGTRSPSLSSVERGKFERRAMAPLNQYRAFIREIPESLKKRESRIKTPILVLFGRDDPYLEAPNSPEWNAVGLDVTIRILAGGHWIHQANPAVINTLMLDFIGSHSKFVPNSSEFRAADLDQATLRHGGGR
jgi:pimeloyl-ACP methyl ester carboxylesterase